MAPDRFGVWSPHRDSNSIRAFKAALNMRSEPWHWYEDKQMASWWVIDGTQTSLGSLNSALAEHKKSGPIQALILAPSWNNIEDPVWSFFKTPLNTAVLFAWIDRCIQQHLPQAVLAGQHLRLKRWPNLTRYNSAIDNPADGVHLALACARMLESSTTYEEIAVIAQNRALLDKLLADARQAGILHISKEAIAAPQAANASPPPPPAKTDAWSLVKRLLSKFT